MEKEVKITSPTGGHVIFSFNDKIPNPLIVLSIEVWTQEKGASPRSEKRGLDKRGLNLLREFLSSNSG